MSGRQSLPIRFGFFDSRKAEVPASAAVLSKSTISKMQHTSVAEEN